MGMLPPVIAELRAQTSEFTAKMGEARAEMEKTSSKGSAAFKGLQSVGKAALVGVAGAAVAVGVAGVEMADKYEAAHARLQSAVKASGQSMTGLQKQVDTQGKSFAKLGYNQAQYEDALARLTQATNDPKKALADMGVVANLAAARHMDLTSAATLVGKVAQGNSTVLKRYGIDLGTAAGGATKVKAAQVALSAAQTAYLQLQAKIHASGKITLADHQALDNAQRKVKADQDKLTQAQHAGADAIAALGKRFSGSAAAQADTFGGKVKALKSSLDDLLIKIGMWLIPIIEKLVGEIMKVIGWFEKHTTVAEALGIAVGTVLVAAIAAYIGSMVVAAAATIAAMAPLLLIVAAVAVLAGGIVYLWTHWDQIWGWIAGHKAYALLIAVLAPILVPIFALVGAVIYVKDHWSTLWPEISGFISKFWGVVQPLLADTAGAFLMVATFIDDVVHGKWSNAWADAEAVVKQFATKVVPDLMNIQTDLSNAMYYLGALAVAHLQLGMETGAAGLAIWVASLPAKIIAFFARLPADMNEIGVEIVQGLWFGIQSLGGWLEGKLKGWLHSIFGAFGKVASFLGISSPSKLTMYHGQMLAAGLLQGWQDGLKGMTLTAPSIGFAPAASGGTVVHLAVQNTIGVNGIPSQSAAAAAGQQVGGSVVHELTAALRRS